MERTKRVAIFAVCLFLSTLLNSVNADQGGSCGDNLTWSFHSDTLTITGRGKMTDFTLESDAPWGSLRYDIQKVDIKEGVTSIGNYAFYDSYYLVDVKIASTVTGIGSFAFAGCEQLVNISIPLSVSSIGNGAFSDCERLTSIDVEDGNMFFKSSDGVLFNNEFTVLVQYPAGKKDESYTLPDSVISIESYAFDHCRAKSLILSDGLTSIGDHAFFHFDYLTSITIPASVVSIGTAAFTGCIYLSSINVEDGNEHFSSVSGVLFNHNLTTLIRFPPRKSATSYRIPDGVRSVGNSAFYSCANLKGVVFSDTVNSIGDYAFYGCGGFSSVTFGNNVSSIGAYALSSCYSLKTVSIPKSVVFIGNFAFYSCMSLSSIQVDNSNEHFSSISGVLFNQDDKSLVIYPLKKTGTEYTIPDGITSIENRAFSQNELLQKVTLGNSVTSIGDYAFYYSSLANVSFPSTLTSIGCNSFSHCRNLYSLTIPVNVASIGDDAFASCTSLTSIDVEEGNAHFKSVDGVLFDLDQNSLVQCPINKQNTTFFIPDGVTKIQDSAFCNCFMLESIRIPESVTMIGDSAFYSCLSLSSIVIPEKVTSIGSYSFSICSSLKEVIIPDSVKTIGDRAFSSCYELRDVQIGNGVESIGESAFSDDNLTTITIPKSVRSIGAFAFEYCDHLTSINVEEGNEYYKSIDGVLFNSEQSTLISYPMGNSRSTYVVPDQVIEIEENAFYNCVNYAVFRGSAALSSLTSFPRSSPRGDYLTSVIISDNVTVIGKEAFGCVKMNTVTIGSNVKEIGPGAFSECEYLTSIIIPESVEVIGKGAFSSCGRLTSVYYLGSKTVSTDIFPYCDSLESVCVSPSYESLYFSGIEIDSTLDACQPFQSMFNHCYKPKYVNGELIDEMRENASEWLSKSNGCIEYHCDNESGGVSWSICNNSDTDDIIHMCVEDKCIVRNVNEETDKWVVELDMEGVSATEMNISEVVMMITELAGNGIKELSVGYEINDGGYVIRIVIYAKDENDANLIAEAIKTIPKGTECLYGVLCRTKNVRVKGDGWMLVSSGHQAVLDFVIVMLLVISMMMMKL